MWNATGVIHAPAFGGPEERVEGGYMFNDLRLMSDHGGAYPLCDGTLAEEPIFGSCSGVLLRQNEDPPVLLTAKHCISSLLEDGEDTFVFFDYDSLNIMVGGDSFTSRNFAQLDWQNVKQHPSLDIALVGLSWQMGAAPESVRAAAPSQPNVGQLVGSVGYPSGRPRKRIFGKGVTVGNTNSTTFEAFIDSFAISSGSPIFNLEGEVLGVLSHQKDISDYVPRIVDGQKCEALAVVSSIVKEGPTIVKLSSMDW
jgi:hypothetical protein